MCNVTIKLYLFIDFLLKRLIIHQTPFGKTPVFCSKPKEMDRNTYIHTILLEFNEFCQLFRLSILDYLHLHLFNEKIYIALYKKKILYFIYIF